MKILYIAQSNAWGGSNVALLNIIKYMKQFGHEIYLITSSPEGRFIDEISKLDIPYYYPPQKYTLTIWPKVKNPLKFVKRTICTIYENMKGRQFIREKIIEIRPNIVHTNVGPLDLALTTCKKLDIPHVWHMREYQDKDFDMHFMPSKSRFIKRIHSEQNYNIAITKDVFDYWQLRPDKDKVIYDGVFSDAILPKKNQEKGKYILFTGRIEEAKGADIAISAFAKYIHKYGDNGYKLLLAGYYDELSAYWKYCHDTIKEEGIEDKVKFLGHRTDVYDLMTCAKAMIVSSRFEGFGFITVEAMLNHCPVIGRMTGGTKEQIEIGSKFEKGPIALPFLTVDECAEQINEAISTDTTSITERAYDMVTSHYTTEISGHLIESYYKQILDKRDASTQTI